MVKAGVTARYPAALPLVADLGVYTNREDVTLTDAIGSAEADITLPLNDVSFLEVGMALATLGAAGYEIMRIISINVGGSSVDVARAVDGTVRVAHAEGQTLYAIPAAYQFNQLVAEAQAIMATIGITGAFNFETDPTPINVLNALTAPLDTPTVNVKRIHEDGVHVVEWKYLTQVSSWAGVQLV